MAKPLTLVLVSFIWLLGCATTPEQLGLVQGQLAPCPSTPNCVNSQATDKDQFVAPITFGGTQQEAQKRLLQILEGLERSKLVTLEDNYIRAEFTSQLFRFVDDVEFYFPATEQAQMLIHFRSASRLGYSDLGTNRRRINKITKLFNLQSN